MASPANVSRFAGISSRCSDNAVPPTATRTVSMTIPTPRASRIATTSTNVTASSATAPRIASSRSCSLRFSESSEVREMRTAAGRSRCASAIAARTSAAVVMASAPA